MKTVLVLGGGGAKALAHAGAWKAVREAGLQVSHIIGTSFGAVIGAAVSAGVSEDELLARANTLKTKDVGTLDWLALARGIFATAILKTDGLKATIRKLMPATRFDELKIPFTLTTTDLDSGELVLLGSPVHCDPMKSGGPVRHLGADVPLIDALYASCALPLYFEPETIHDRRLVDGGLRAVVALGVAACVHADRVIAVDVGSGFDETPAQGGGRLEPGLVRAHGDAIRVMMAAQTERAVESWPADAPPLTYVRAVAEKGATFVLGQSERYFGAGYEATRAALR